MSQKTWQMMFDNPFMNDTTKLINEVIKANNDMAAFEKELTALINKHNMENLSNTPDYILSRYLVNCLNNLSTAIVSRDGYNSCDHPSEE